jgi:predicted Zn-dependent peptidase
MSQSSLNHIDTFIKAIPSSSSVTIAFFLDVGLPSELIDQVGISHFLEHMCFRGTKKRTAYQITQEVDALGAHINAYTSKEFTCYYMTLLPESLEQGIDILTDIVFHSNHDEKSIALEKSIISEEIKMYEDTPDEKIMDVFNAQLFNNAYLGRPILGTFDSIGSFDASILHSFYRQYFNQKNIKCVIAGAIDNHAHAEGLLKKSLSDIDFNGSESDPVSLKGLTFKSSDLHVDKDLEQMHFCMGYPGISYVHEDRYALTALTTILGGSMSSRLFQAVREKEGLAYSIYCSPSFYRDTGAIQIYAGTSKESYHRAVDCILEQIKTLLSDGIDQEEFQRAKQQLKGSIIINLEGSSAWANWLGRQFIYNTGMSHISDIESRIDAVALDDVTRVANNLMDDTYKVEVSLGRLKPND